MGVIKIPLLVSKCFQLTNEFIKRLLWNAGFDYRLHCFSFFACLCMVTEERSMDEPLPNATLG